MDFSIFDTVEKVCLFVTALMFGAFAVYGFNGGGTPWILSSTLGIISLCIFPYVVKKAMGDAASAPRLVEDLETYLKDATNSSEN